MHSIISREKDLPRLKGTGFWKILAEFNKIPANWNDWLEKQKRKEI